MNLYVYADPASPAASLYTNVDAEVPTQFPELVVGDTIHANLYLIDGEGGYDSRSGSAAYTLSVSIGDPTETISGGTFTITHSTNTTGNLAWNITSDGLQTALNALPSVIADGGLTVTGASGLFQIAWNTTGTKTEFGASGALLTPYGAVEIATTNDGTTGYKTQLIQLMTASLCESGFEAITDGWAIEINLNTLPAISALTGEAFKNKVVQVTIYNASGERVSYLQMLVVIRNRISGSGSSPYHPPETSYVETDPLFAASEAANFVPGDKTALDTVVSYGNHATAGYATRTYVSTYYLPLAGGTLTGPLGIGNYPTPCAALTVDSTTRGVLFPRMTKAQRDAISSPIAGLLIYQLNETAGFYYYTGSAWLPASSAGSGGDYYCADNGKTYRPVMRIADGDDNKPYFEYQIVS